MPSSGTIGVGAGAVWVIDRQGGDDADPETSALLRVDPNTGAVTKRIPGVIGASIVVTEDAVWVASAATDRLVRVRLDGERVTAIRTELAEAGDDIYPYGVAVASGSVWVANHHAGTIARVDPLTNTLADVVRWGEPGGGGPTHLLATDSSVWVTSVRTSDLTEIDPARPQVVRRIDLSPVGACGGLASDDGNVWSTSGFDRPYACSQPEHWGVSRLDLARGSVTRIDIAARPVDVEIGYGSVWVLTDEPKTELIRLEAATQSVVGRLELPSRPDYANPLAIGLGALWVRLVDPLGRGDGALVKVVPD